MHGDRYGQQYLAVSRNGARTFATTVGVGPHSNYAYAVKAEGIFPGDYIGTSFRRDGRLYAAWCVSSKPTSAKAKYRQVVYGAVLTTCGDDDRGPVSPSKVGGTRCTAGRARRARLAG